MRRYCICAVGEGFSVEDSRTGERISYHRTFGGAERALNKKTRRKSPPSRSVRAVSGGLPSLGKRR